MGEAAAQVPKSERKLAWRPWLRAAHRDAGYLVVGLTFVYAVSGLAVNHIDDWSEGNPSYSAYSETRELGPMTGTDDEIAARVRGAMQISKTPREVYRRSDDELDLTFDDKRALHVNVRTGQVVDEGQRPRFFLRAANWLHLNRGKKAWKWIADSYAAILLLLSLSGMMMIPGKKGFFFRGAVLVALGIGVPIVYVALAGPT